MDEKEVRIELQKKLEEEVNNLNLWLPKYERYYALNPQDTFIGRLIREGREKLKTLKMLLEQDFYKRIKGGRQIKL